jgi:hypothetical protein
VKVCDLLETYLEVILMQKIERNDAEPALLYVTRRWVVVVMNPGDALKQSWGTSRRRGLVDD